MRILFTGPLNPWSTTEARRRALIELGHEVIALDVLPYFDRWPRLLAKPQWYWLLGPAVCLYNRALIRRGRKSAADVIWIDQGVAVWPGTVRALRQGGGVVVHYTSDDAEKWTRVFRHYRRALAFYDVNVTTNEANIPWLTARGARKVVRAEFGYDPGLHRPVELDETARGRYGSAVVFVGHWEPTTERALSHLFAAGVPLRVWGGGWKNARNPAFRPTAAQYHPLHGPEYVKALRAATICLCFLSKWNRNQSAGRTFEIPAVGGFLLAERTEAHLGYYAEAKEAEFFESLEELTDKIRYYLAHAAEREDIAYAGHRRCLDSAYRNVDRVRDILGRL